MVVSLEILGPAATALLTAIGYLWREQLRTKQATEKKLAECEHGHKTTLDRMLELGMELAELRGRQDGINQLAEQVLKAVATPKKDLSDDS